MPTATQRSIVDPRRVCFRDSPPRDRRSKMPPARLSTVRTAVGTRGSRPSRPALDQAGRERILAAAIRSFSEVGYEGTTTAGLARDAGVTQPLVHHHFGSKA